MKGATVRAYSLLIIAVSISAMIIPKLYDARSRYQVETISQFGQLPSSVVQVLSFEFKGIIADYLFLKTTTYLGQKLIAKTKPTPTDWEMIYQMIKQITDLDNRFWDPYLFAAMMFSWETNMLDQADEMLLKATIYRPDDYRPLYLLGFNNFFIRNNFKVAADYMRRAARLPQTPFYLKGLAARLSLYGDDTISGIIFLEAMLQETDDPKITEYLTKRIEALKIIASLEKKILSFKADHGRLPVSFEELTRTGYMETIPKDPYGGEFILLKTGRVYTTSKLVEVKKEAKPNE